jgi:hypothetical protein
MAYDRLTKCLDASVTLPGGGRDDFWTYEAVVERLVEAFELWRRSPGGGQWPFAKDAPWHLMTRTTRLGEGRVKGMELARLLQEDDARETAQWQGRERPRPLTRDEVDRRDETTEWLTFVQADARKVVVAAIAQLASGRTNIDWRSVKWQVGAEIESKGVYRRFTRAITAIVKRLNG